MTPTLAICNPMNLRYANSELFSDYAELRSTASHHSNFENLRFGNLGRSVRLSVSHFFRMFNREVVNASRAHFRVNLKKVPSLIVAIHEVVSLRSSKKVVWIYASAIIASVKNIHAVRNLTVKQSVCESVGQFHKTFFDVSKTEHPITRSVFSGRPNPTSRLQLWILHRVRKWPILVDLCPKSSNIFFSHNQIEMTPHFLT